MNEFFLPKPLRVTKPDGEVFLYPSHRAAVRELGVQYIQVQRFVRVGVVKKGKFAGWKFELEAQ